jgi:hypothetical protein
MDSEVFLAYQKAARREGCNPTTSLTTTIERVKIHGQGYSCS